MLIYGLLIPLTILDGAAMGLFSHLIATNFSTWLWIALAITNILPISVIICRYSRKEILVFNMLLYNSALTGSYLIAVSFLKGDSPSPDYWLGLLIAFVGLILMKFNREENIEIDYVNLT